MMIDTVRTLDDIFIAMAEADVGAGVPIDDAVEQLWTAFERGELRLVADGERLRVEPFEGTPAERQAAAENNWPLAAARKRVLCCVYDDDDEARGS
jgi:hypothetical protein